MLLSCHQDNSGSRMKGFKFLLQAAEAGDRPCMILVARAFDTGINLSPDRSETGGTYQIQYQLVLGCV